MNVSRSKPPVTRFLACVLLLTYAPGCTTWRSQSGNTPSIIEAKQPTCIRVVRSDGSRFVLENPTIIGDSLVGMLRPGPGSVFRAAIHLHEIGAVETREIDVLAVLEVVATGVALIVGRLE